jgi:hypothetical protein
VAVYRVSYIEAGLAHLQEPTKVRRIARRAVSHGHIAWMHDVRTSKVLCPELQKGRKCSKFH